jgi:hypothetical protein
LIAIEAMMNTCREFFHVIYAMVAIFVPSGLMSFGLCCGLLQNVYLIFGQSTAVCMLVIAADRLSAILFPIWLMIFNHSKKSFFK